eukprot:2232299-Alexandrium_andersonii.AAC.1
MRQEEYPASGCLSRSWGPQAQAETKARHPPRPGPRSCQTTPRPPAASQAPPGAWPMPCVPEPVARAEAAWEPLEHHSPQAARP